MKAGRELTDYLHDIMDAIQKIERFIEGLDFAQFAGDDKTNFAVVRALEIIGEATRKIPNSVRARYPSVPWREMAGLRDKLIHDYFLVSLSCGRPCRKTFQH